MEAVRSYQLMGFWNGAQMALDEYNAKGVSLNIIVRDISNNESKLRHLMENEALMRDVDLIVGPFFGKLFTIAAHYAKQYQIPIVIPFSSRQDFIEEKEYVFMCQCRVLEKEQAGCSPLGGKENSQTGESAQGGSSW